MASIFPCPQRLIELIGYSRLTCNLLLFIDFYLDLQYIASMRNREFIIYIRSNEDDA